MISGQFVRYAVVGLMSNVTVYLLYLLSTQAGLGPKFAMTVTYFLAVLVSFAMNRRWTFRHHGRLDHAAVRYMLAYSLGYVLNFIGLLLLVDFFGLPHQYIQALLIVVIAVFLFFMQRFWVFRDGLASTGRACR